MIVRIIVMECVLISLFVLAGLTSFPGAQEVLFREDFDNLNRWEPFYFRKRETHTSYTIESHDTGAYLKAETDASASAIIHDEEFNVYEFPVIRWRWKAENVYEHGNAGTREGDDFPLRVCIMFRQDRAQNAGFWSSMKREAVKLVYGHYPPHSALEYVWANREHAETIIPSSYAENVRLILVQKGDSNVGTWQDQQADIVEDYQKAFHEKPPPMARMAVMSDSDNTGETAVSYLDYIELRRE